jgi:hypothetical protein
MRRQAPSIAQMYDEIERLVVIGTEFLVRKSMLMTEKQMFDSEPLTHATMAVDQEAASLLNRKASCVKLEYCDAKYIQPTQNLYLPELCMLGRVHSVDDKNDSDGIGIPLSSCRVEVLGMLNPFTTTNNAVVDLRGY